MNHERDFSGLRRLNKERPTSLKGSKRGSKWIENDACLLFNLPTQGQ
jgi:hypothetical protein